MTFGNPRRKFFHFLVQDLVAVRRYWKSFLDFSTVRPLELLEEEKKNFGAKIFGVFGVPTKMMNRKGNFFHQRCKFNSLGRGGRFFHVDPPLLSMVSGRFKKKKSAIFDILFFVRRYFAFFGNPRKTHFFMGPRKPPDFL